MGSLFKNAVVFRIQPNAFDFSTLNEGLKKHLFSPCGPVDTHKSGWISPIGEESDVFAHVIMNRCFMLLKTEKKTVPARVLRDACEKAENKWKKENNEERVPKDKRSEIKQAVGAKLLEHAFPKSSVTWAYIDKQNNLLVVLCSSRNAAEEIRSKIVEHSGVKGYPVENIETQHNPAKIMSNWLAYEQMPAGWITGTKCNLRHESEKGSIAYRNLELGDSHLQEYLQEDKLVSSLEVTISEKIRAVITEDLVLQSIKLLEFDEIAETEESPPEPETALQARDAALIIESAAIAELHAAVVAAFGGPVASKVVAEPEGEKQAA